MTPFSSFAYRHPFLSAFIAGGLMWGWMSVRLHDGTAPSILGSLIVGSSVFALWMPRFGYLTRRLEAEQQPAGSPDAA
jgi:hypothetical protein